MVNYVNLFNPSDDEPPHSGQKDVKTPLGKPRRGLRAKPGHSCPGEMTGKPSYGKRVINSSATLFSNSWALSGEAIL